MTASIRELYLLEKLPESDGQRPQVSSSHLRSVAMLQNMSIKRERRQENGNGNGNGNGNDNEKRHARNRARSWNVNNSFGSTFT